jgi:hypothetical protein
MENTKKRVDVYLCAGVYKDIFEKNFRTFQTTLILKLTKSDNLDTGITYAKGKYSSGTQNNFFARNNRKDFLHNRNFFTKSDVLQSCS